MATSDVLFSSDDEEVSLGKLLMVLRLETQVEGGFYRYFNDK